MSDPDLEEIPAYCDVPEDAIEDRRAQARDMISRARDIEALEDGYRLTFPGDRETLEAVMVFTLEERRCCPTGKFTVRFGGADDPVHLDFRGPEPMKEDMRAGLELDRWFDEGPA